MPLTSGEAARNADVAAPCSGGFIRNSPVASARRAFSSWVLSTHGDEKAVSLRAVARQAGIATQSCYLHFATRDDLLWALHEREFAALRAALERAGSPDDSPLDRLRARCRAYAAYAEREPGPYSLLFSGRGAEHHSWDGRLPGEPTSALWVDTVAECVDEVSDLDAIAADLWSGLHGAIALRSSLPAFPWPGDLDTTIERLINALVIRRSA